MDLDAPEQHHVRWPALLALMVALFAAGRLLWLTHLYSVNIPFWDQWGYYDPIWDETKSLWHVFTMQHGPHRGGLGYALCRIALPWTHGNVRADAFAVVTIVMGSSGVALWLVRRVTGSLRWHDVGLVMLFLMPTLAGIAAGTPNPTHGALPLLLVLLSAGAWTIQRPVLRYALVTPLVFLSIFTGFALFAGVLTPIMAAADGWMAWRKGERRTLVLAGLAIVVAGLSWARFLSGYVLVDQVPEGMARPGAGDLFAFVCLVYARLFAASAGTIGYVLLGALVLLASAATAAWCLWTASRGDDWRKRAAVVYLVAFGAMFAAAMAAGRAHLPLVAATEVRYLPLMLPGAAGLYLGLRMLPAGAGRRVAVGCFLLGGLWAGLYLPARDRAEMQRHADGKRRWVEAYRQTRDVAQADAMARFAVSPNRRKLPARLERLEQLQLELLRATPRDDGRP